MGCPCVFAFQDPLVQTFSDVRCEGTGEVLGDRPDYLGGEHALWVGIVDPFRATPYLKVVWLIARDFCARSDFGWGVAES